MAPIWRLKQSIRADVAPHVFGKGRRRDACGSTRSQVAATMMNSFRFIGDMSHVASFVLLLLQLRYTKSASGACF